MSFAGGKLNLKGGLPVAGGAKKKKKSKKEKKEREKEVERALAEDSEGEDVPKVVVDNRTASQKKHEAAMAKREEKEIQSMASKTHREKVAEFNEYLSNLTEHYDIPKVGPG